MHVLIRRPLIGLAIGATVGVVATATGTAEWSERPAAHASATEAAPQMGLARAYAEQHGLTSCSAPADAELDDVFLTLAADPLGQPTTTRIVPVDLDTALDSAGARLVLLACDTEEGR